MKSWNRDVENLEVVVEHQDGPSGTCTGPVVTPDKTSPLLMKYAYHVIHMS